MVGLMKIASGIIVIIAVMVILWSIYIGSREVISLLMIIPLNLVVAVFFLKIQEKLSNNSEIEESKFNRLSFINSIAYSLTAIALCWAILSYIDSGTALFGDAYKQRVELENIKKKSWQNAASEMNYVSFAENRLKENLKDPSSADFKGSRTGHNGSVCGMVNSKNSFGAYTGYKNFIQIGSFTMIDDDTSQFSKQWETYCN